MALLLGAGSALRAQSGSSTEQNPTFTFDTPGSKRVSLTACNASGCTTHEKVVVVLDPKPQIQTVTIPATAGAGRTVTLQAVTSGRPALQHDWILTDGVVDSSAAAGNPAAWTPPAVPGTYSMRLKVTNTDGSATSASTLVNVVPWTFNDVPPEYWAWRFVESLAAQGITSGCGGGDFCPESLMTRAEMAVFLIRSKEGSAYVPPPCVTAPFLDIPCTSPFAPWIQELVARGVTAGCGGGDYCPGDAVTRDQMAVFLLATKEGAGYAPPPADCDPPRFADVACTSPFAPWIQELVARGVTAGCGGGNYCPSSSVTRSQMAVFLTTTFNLPTP